MAYENYPKLSELKNVNKLEILPSVEQIRRFCTLMQKGCFVRVQTGCSLSDLLCDEFQISPAYIKNEIKVIFLDNSPVDDLDTAIIKDGGVLALSAAMPGLVGAAMRRDGPSWMRNSITYHENDSEHDKLEGIVNMKLFNQVMADLGESFLRRGVYVESTFLTGFLERFTGEFWKNVKQILRNGEIITVDDMFHSLGAEQNWVEFSIQ
ncbi:hypothetical protein EG829_00390 [bacterium]|nr:hypothetical protein [bacterium]